MHWSKALVLGLAFLALVLLLVIYPHQPGLSEYWLLLLVPPLVMLIAYSRTPEARATARAPLSARRLAWAYLKEHGFWVLLWLGIAFYFYLVTES